MPPRRFGLHWALELSTAEPDAEPRGFQAREVIRLEGRSLVLLRRQT